ncbi:MAG: ABC transporter permease [Oscillospiraceae bacterium]|nr:ABC transporter permease [Oscillospiraceae bacterium]
MKILLLTECMKLRRSKIVWISVAAAFLISAIVFLGGTAENDSIRLIDSAGWYMSVVQPMSTMFVIPAVIALLGSYMICREEQEDTIKSLRLIPINETKMTAAKMIITFAFCILIYLLLFVITLTAEAILHVQDLSVSIAAGYLTAYIIDAAGVFLAVSPVIALVSYMKKSYWISLVIAEIYSFAGLFMSMSNTLKTLYPITAIFGVSGYYETSAVSKTESIAVLLVCGCLSFVILKGLKFHEDR